MGRGSGCSMSRENVSFGERMRYVKKGILTNSWTKFRVRQAVWEPVGYRPVKQKEKVGIGGLMPMRAVLAKNVPCDRGENFRRVPRGPTKNREHERQDDLFRAKQGQEK